MPGLICAPLLTPRAMERVKKYASEKEMRVCAPLIAEPLQGPYLSERQWGTKSATMTYAMNGAAWDFFPHDHARSRAYRWGEDGIMGISDRHQLVCFALALWNGRDPILKERLFGLSANEGNHAEERQEYYSYLLIRTRTPT